MRDRSIKAALLALALQLVPAISAGTENSVPSGASTSPFALVTSHDLSTPYAQELLWRLRESMARRDDVMPIDLPSQIDSNPLQNVDQLNDALERGIQALNEGDAKRAESLLTGALEYLPAWRSHLPATRRGMVTLARAELALGKKLRAQRAFALLLRFDPDFELPADEASPELQGSLTVARRELANPTLGTIRFHGAQKGAGIFLNGRFVGLAPLDPTPLPVGLTHLRVSVDPRHHWIKTTRIQADRPTFLQPRLRVTQGGRRYMELIRSLPPSLEAQTVPDEVRELAKWSNVDEVVLFEVDEMQVEAVRYSPGRDEVLSHFQIVRTEQPSPELADAIISSLYAAGEP